MSSQRSPKRLRTAAALTLSLSATLVAWPAVAVDVDRAWARATVPGQLASGAYMSLISDRNARIVGVETPAAALAQIHTMAMRGTTMTMRALDAVDLPAGKRVELKPGAMHVMLMDLKEPLKAGTRFPLVLRIEGPDHKVVQQSVSVEVRDGPPDTARP